MPQLDEAIDALPPLREVIREHGLSARKTLGQNFLLDLNLTARIARACLDQPGGVVLEIGPGPGGLTRALLKAGAGRVIAIEKDPRCVAALEPLRRAAAGRLEIIEADALSIDEGALLSEPAALAANLPYNISTKLLIGWLDRLRHFTTLTLLFQKEVAERIAAPPGSRTYGRLSVRTQWCCEATKLFDISPSAFTPRPKVTSTLVRLTPRPEPLAPAPRDMLERVLRAAFGQRRKMIRSSLKQVSASPEALIARAGLDPRARAEDLDIAAHCALANALAAELDEG